MRGGGAGGEMTEDWGVGRRSRKENFNTCKFTTSNPKEKGKGRGLRDKIDHPFSSNKIDCGLENCFRVIKKPLGMVL